MQARKKLPEPPEPVDGPSARRWSGGTSVGRGCLEPRTRVASERSMTVVVAIARASRRSRVASGRDVRPLVGVLDAVARARSMAAPTSCRFALEP